LTKRSIANHIKNNRVDCGNCGDSQELSEIINSSKNDKLPPDPLGHGNKYEQEEKLLSKFHNKCKRSNEISAKNAKAKISDSGQQQQPTYFKQSSDSTV
jgi:hypothetical protein